MTPSGYKELAALMESDGLDLFATYWTRTPVSSGTSSAASLMRTASGLICQRES
jgi:hypothetical protein